MTDLVERLRAKAASSGKRMDQAACVETEAADEIERLQKKESELQIKSEFLSARQCPDHNGKWPRGECLQCEIERLTLKLEHACEAGAMERMGMEAAESRLGAVQAKLDAVMLEYCPDEMTEEQVAEWTAHQDVAGDDRAVEGPLPKKKGMTFNTCDKQLLGTADAGQERDDPQFSPEFLYRKLVEAYEPTEFNTVRVTCKSTHFTNPDTGECVFCGEKEPIEGK